MRTDSAVMPGRATGFRTWPANWAAWATGRRGRWRQAVLWTLIGLVLLRLLAPWILTLMANRALANGDEVRGSISGLSLDLLACDYIIHDLDLRSQRSDARWEPLLQVDHIHCDLAWGPLLGGALAGHLRAHQPVLHVFAEQSPVLVKTPAAPPWQDAIGTVVRVRLTALDIIDGRILYHDERRQIETGIDDIDARIEDLTIPEPALTHRCPFTLTARTPGDGRLHVTGEADVLAKSPTFLVRAQLEDVDLPGLNPLTRQINNLTFADGTFQGYAELVADGRRLGGYLKVLFHRLDIHSIGSSDPDTGTGFFWGVVVGLAEDILENTELDQHAARIPLSGDLDDPDADVWTAIGSALSNAFIGALAPGFAGKDN